MAVNQLDLEGERRGCLTALRVIGVTAGRKLIWLCRCDCGAEVRMNGSAFKYNGHSRCWHGVFRKSRTPEYWAWNRMWSRCYDGRNHRFARYGRREISVCERWLEFENFLNDMGPRPSPDHSLGRIDNDGDYEPGNCRWEVSLEQARNTSRTVYLAPTGEKLIELCERLGKDRGVVYGRLKLGWTLDEALNRPVRPKKRKVCGDGRSLGSV